MGVSKFGARIATVTDVLSFSLLLLGLCVFMTIAFFCRTVLGCTVSGFRARREADRVAGLAG